MAPSSVPASESKYLYRRAGVAAGRARSRLARLAGGEEGDEGVELRVGVVRVGLHFGGRNEIGGVAHVEGEVGGVARGVGAYCTSKAAVHQLTKALALELGPRGIRVNSIHPGGILTPMANPTGLPRDVYDRGFWIYAAQRSGEAADIGAAAAYLASDDAKYCIGTELSVDGGLNAGHYYMAMPGAPTDPNKR